MDIGSLVRISETAKIQYNINPDKVVLGLVLSACSLRKLLDVPSDELGYEVLLPNSDIDIFYESDLSEVKA